MVQVPLGQRNRMSETPSYGKWHMVRPLCNLIPSLDEQHQSVQTVAMVGVRYSVLSRFCRHVESSENNKHYIHRDSPEPGVQLFTEMSVELLGYYLRGVGFQPPS